MVTLYMGKLLDCAAYVVYFPADFNVAPCNESHWAIPGTWPED